jgi:hypothetical protein
MLALTVVIIVQLYSDGPKTFWVESGYDCRSMWVWKERAEAWAARNHIEPPYGPHASCTQRLEDNDAEAYANARAIFSPGFYYMQAPEIEIPKDYVKPKNSCQLCKIGRTDAN